MSCPKALHAPRAILEKRTTIEELRRPCRKRSDDHHLEYDQAFAAFDGIDPFYAMPTRNCVGSAG